MKKDFFSRFAPLALVLVAGPGSFSEDTVLAQCQSAAVQAKEAASTVTKVGFSCTNGCKIKKYLVDSISSAVETWGTKSTSEGSCEEELLWLLSGGALYILDYSNCPPTATYTNYDSQYTYYRVYSAKPQYDWENLCESGTAFPNTPDCVGCGQCAPESPVLTNYSMVISNGCEISTKTYSKEGYYLGPGNFCYHESTRLDYDNGGLCDEYTTAMILQQSIMCAQRSLRAVTNWSYSSAVGSYYISADELTTTCEIARWRVEIRGTTPGELYKLRLHWSNNENGVLTFETTEVYLPAPDAEVWYFPSEAGEILTAAQETTTNCAALANSRVLMTSDITPVPPNGNSPTLPSFQIVNAANNLPQWSIGSSGNGCSSCGGGSGNLDVGSLFKIDLGPGPATPSLGYLKIGAVNPSPALATPAGLDFVYDKSSSGSSIEIVRLFTGELRQIVTPNLFLNISNNGGYQYTLRIMKITAKGGITNDLYTWDPNTNYLLKEYLVENPDASPTQYSRLKITDTQTGLQWMFAYSNSLGGWNATLPANFGSMEMISTNHAANAWTYIERVRSPSGGLISEHTQVYTNYPWGVAILSDTEGNGSEARSRTWTYYDPPPFTPRSSRPPIDTVTEPDGAWRKVLQYTNDGLIAIELHGIDTGVTNQADLCRKLAYWYGSVDAANDDGTRKADQPRKEEEYYKGQLIRRTYHLYSKESDSPHYDKTVNCPNPANLLNDPANQVSTTYYAAGSASVQYIANADGTVTIPTFSAGPNGSSVSTVEAGESDGFTPPLVKSGIRTQTTLDARGYLVSQTVQAISSSGVYGPVISSKTLTASDEYGRPTRIDYLDGSYETFSYSPCCGLDTYTDRNGITRLFEYDELHRPLGYTVVSYPSTLSVTNVFDAAGRAVATVRNGGGTSVIVQTRKQYDTAGRLITETNALGGVTSYSESFVNGIFRQTSTVAPDGGTSVSLYLPDGSLTNISGTAAFPMRYQYGVELNPPQFFTKEIKLDAAGNATEWVKTYQDGLGRSDKTVYAAATGAPGQTNFYNNKGQLTKQVDPDGVTTLYLYNAAGEQISTVTDLNPSDGDVNYNVDRITQTTNAWLLSTDGDNSRSTDIKRTVTWVWTSAGSTTPSKVSVVDSSTDGLHTWRTAYRDQSTPVETRTDVTPPTEGNDWTRTTTQTAPDNSTTVTVEQYGRVLSVSRYNSSGGQVSQTCYGYDAHGRQAMITDARNGTITFYFNAADQVQTTVSPDPGTGPQITINTFDKMGRVTSVQNPDGNIVTNVYFPNGLLQKTWGSRVYPVEYSYDAQGRMRTNKTWQSFSAGNGTAVTRWNYDPFRGWLKSKDYPDASSGNPPATEGTGGPLYTYTAGGRLSTRTWLRPGIGGSALVTTYKYGFNDGATGNEHGDLVSVQYSNDPAGTPTVTYSHDRRGRRLQVDRDGMSTGLTYNDANEQTGETYSGGVLAGLSVNATYNNLLQRDTLSLGGTGTYSVGYGYDNASRLATVADTASIVRYSYLANSPLVSEIFFTNSGSLRMTSTKQIDRLNRLQSISSVPSGSGAPSLPLSYAYTYNSANQRTRCTLADGSFWVYMYDYLGQVTSGKRYWQDGTPVAGQQFEYGFDDIGNRKTTSVGGDASGGGLRGDSYSPNRLNQYSSRTVNGAVDQIGVANPTAAVTVNGTIAYRKGEYFDYALPVGNGTAPQYPEVTVASSYPPGQTNKGNTFVQQTPESFGYDADGNMTSDGRWSYTWDAENRLIKMESLANAPTGSKRRLELTYDHQSRRIKSKVTNLDTGLVTSENNFLYDGWNLVAELNATNNAIIRSYVWGLDLSGSLQGAGGVGGLLSVWDSSTLNNQPSTHFVAYDGNGNVMALVSTQDGSTLARYEYGPFGEVLRATAPMAKPNPFRFSTKYRDDETDLLYYGFRYYDPRSGVWVSRDPSEEKSSPNLYGFLRADSVSKVDLLGLLETRFRKNTRSLIPGIFENAWSAPGGFGEGVWGGDEDYSMSNWIHLWSGPANNGICNSIDGTLPYPEPSAPGDKPQRSEHAGAFTFDARSDCPAHFKLYFSVQMNVSSKGPNGNALASIWVAGRGEKSISAVGTDKKQLGFGTYVDVRLTKRWQSLIYYYPTLSFNATLATPLKQSEGEAYGYVIFTDFEVL